MNRNIFAKKIAQKIWEKSYHYSGKPSNPLDKLLDVSQKKRTSCKKITHSGNQCLNVNYEKEAKKENL